MTPEQKAAFIFAQAVSALIDIEAMKALNAEREDHGYAQAYSEAAFYELHNKYLIGHNEVIGFFNA